MNKSAQEQLMDFFNTLLSNPGTKLTISSELSRHTGQVQLDMSFIHGFSNTHIKNSKSIFAKSGGEDLLYQIITQIHELNYRIMRELRIKEVDHTNKVAKAYNDSHGTNYLNDDHLIKELEIQGRIKEFEETKKKSYKYE